MDNSGKKAALVTALICLIPAYSAAERTTHYDSTGLVFLNLIAIVFAVFIAIGITTAPAFALFGFYKLRKLSAEEVPQSLLGLACFLGLVLCLYASGSISDFYKDLQSFNVEIIYGR